MYYWPFMPYVSGCHNESVLYLQPATSSQVTMTSYRNCPSCCPLCSTHISSTKALIYNFLHKVVVYIWKIWAGFLLYILLLVIPQFGIRSGDTWCHAADPQPPSDTGNFSFTKAQTVHPKCDGGPSCCQTTLLFHCVVLSVSCVL